MGLRLSGLQTMCFSVGRIRRQPPSGIEDVTINLPDVSQQILRVWHHKVD